MSNLCREARDYRRRGRRALFRVSARLESFPRPLPSYGARQRFGDHLLARAAVSSRQFGRRRPDRRLDAHRRRHVHRDRRRRRFENGRAGRHVQAESRMSVQNRLHSRFAIVSTTTTQFAADSRRLPLQTARDDCQRVRERRFGLPTANLVFFQLLPIGRPRGAARRPLRCSAWPRLHRRVALLFRRLRLFVSPRQCESAGRAIVGS